MTSPATSPVHEGQSIQARRPPLVRRKHTEYGTLEIPFYDEELDVAQGKPHKDVVFTVGPAFQWIAQALAWEFLADNPIWYWDWRTQTQKAFYCDLALAVTDDGDRVTADDLKLVVEVVTTTHKRKEQKDCVLQKKLNELNGVSEFLLFYPDLDDERILEWFRLEGEYYVEDPGRDGKYESRAVPGFVVELLPREQWRPGHKVRVFFQGTEILENWQEHQKRLIAEQEADAAELKAAAAKQEAAAAGQEAAAAKQEAAAAGQKAAAAEDRALKERQARQELEGQLALLKKQLEQK